MKIIKSKCFGPYEIKLHGDCAELVMNYTGKDKEENPVERQKNCGWFSNEEGCMSEIARLLKDTSPGDVVTIEQHLSEFRAIRDSIASHLKSPR